MSFIEPIIVTGQVYTHPDTAVPVVVTKFDRGTVSYSGVDLLETGAYDTKCIFRGRMNSDDFIGTFGVPAYADIFNMGPALKDVFMGLLPEGTILTQGFIGGIEDNEAGDEE